MRTVINQRSEGAGRGEAGYTLVEMAVVLTVVGLLVASFASAYGLYLKVQSRHKTENNASLITASLTSYLIQYGRYPCPARMDLDRSDPDYGVETECDPLVTAPAAPAVAYPGVASTPVTAGTCTNGLCFEEGEVAVDMDPSPLTSNQTPIIRRGAVPFRTLGLPESQSIDGWGSRFHYAVTENLAVTTSYSKKSGGISVYDASGKLLTPTDNRAHYLVFSNGPDRTGAYSQYGKLLNPCPAGPPATALDAENCNTDFLPIALNKKAVYSLARFSTTEGPEHFDDYVKFYSSIETPLWKVSDAGGFHIRDLVEAEVLGNGVGIGVATPATGVALDVSGEVRAKNNPVLASQVCDPGAANCFPVSEFGSVHEKFQCPAGQYINSFGSSGGKYVQCVSAVATDVTCNPGEFVIGIEPDGRLKCQSVTGCGNRALTICGESDTLAAGPVGTVRTTPVHGVSRQETWSCNSTATGNQWQLQSTTGICTCTAVDETYDQVCNGYSGWPVFSDGNWTGSVTLHHVHTCPDDNDSVTETANNCVCSPTTLTQIVTCPSGFSGSITRTNEWVCDSATAGHWTGWTETANSCTCNASTQTQTVSCPAYHTGAINQHRDFQCPGGTWGPWVTDSNTCTCAPGQTETQTTGCSYPNSGTITRERTYDCGALAWGPWTETANSCTCGGTTESQDIGCNASNYESGNHIQERTYDCGTSSWGPWVTTSNTCSCVGAIENRTVSCTAPLQGTIEEQRSYDCATSTWGPWQEAANNCGVVSYSWAVTSSQTGPYGSPSGAAVGSSCLASQVGNKTPCSSPAGGGQYYHYGECTCQ